jgi:hypothetical protein
MFEATVVVGYLTRANTISRMPEPGRGRQPIIRRPSPAPRSLRKSDGGVALPLQINLTASPQLHETRTSEVLDNSSFLYDRN